MKRKSTNINPKRGLLYASQLTLLVFVAAALNGCAGFGFQAEAKESRTLNATHVVGETLHVTTTNGRVDITVDPTLAEVQIEATVTAKAFTYEEALAHLAEIAVVVDHAPGNILDVSVNYGPNGRQNGDGCSFTIRIPAVTGVMVDTKNGSIKLANTAGNANLTTSNGRVTLIGHAGAATVRTSNGSVQVEQVSGKVDVQTSNGRITYISTPDATEAFALRSSNGSITVTIPITVGGSINARTSNGSVRVGGDASLKEVSGSKKNRTLVLDDAANGQSTVTTSNGSITINVEE